MLERWVEWAKDNVSPWVIVVTLPALIVVVSLGVQVGWHIGLYVLASQVVVAGGWYIQGKTVTDNQLYEVIGDYLDE